VRAAIPGIANEIWNQAECGLISISLFRGVLFCLSGIGVWFLANPSLAVLSHFNRGGE